MEAGGFLQGIPRIFVLQHGVGPVFRQSDVEFVTLLNAIRVGTGAEVGCW